MPFLFVSHSSLNKILAIRHILFIGSYYRNLTCFTIFINFFDNSIYWLDQVDKSDKIISVSLQGDKQQMIFSDNGPGVREDDAPYIFNAFYSGKGEEGRGLGLYIAKQLLERNDYSIKLAETKTEKKLSGANFVVDFVSGDDK
jgi:signal transduction histidine kinase